MSQNPPGAISSSDYQVIFDNALTTYKKKTGKDLTSDPLLHRLETCNSPDSVLALLRQQIPRFDQSGSNDQRLTSWVNPAVNVLYTFSSTIGGAVSLAYPPAGVIFTGIASLLSAVLAIGDSQSALIGLFERIENFFIRLGTYIELPPTAEMTDIIVKVMVEVLLILALLTKEIKRGKIKKFLKKLVGRSDIEDALRRLDKLTEEEGRMAAAQGLRATHDVGERVVSIGDDVQDLGDGLEVAINIMDAVLDGGENMRGELRQVARNVSELAKDASDDKRNKLRQDLANWLSPADPSVNFNTADQLRHEGTAEWFTQSSVFKSWKESSFFLWVHGKPGSGKSVLTSAIIQDIKSVCHTALGHMAFFLFDFKDVGKQDARALLSSLIVQLSNQSDGLYNILLRFYSSHHHGTQQPSIAALTQCLEDIVRISEALPIYLIIDALDECPNKNGISSSRDQVLALVERLVLSNLPNLRLCVTSRPETDIRTVLEPLTSTSNSISLHNQSGQKKDIVDFVRSVVYPDKNMRRWREEDKQLVVQTLSDKVDGMFRWVFCQLEILRHCLPPSVRHTLAELPETLDATYERILLEIPKTNRVHAHRLLQCLTVAVRPLAVAELAEILAIDFDSAEGIPKLNEEFRWADQEQAVLSACSSLVVIVWDYDLRRVQFSHFSVKEFLTSDRLAISIVDVLRDRHIRLKPAHIIMAHACLGVLLRLDDLMDKETIKKYPLAEYAGKFIVDHAKFGDVLSRINDGFDNLFDPDKPHFNTWLWLQTGDWDPDWDTDNINTNLAWRIRLTDPFNHLSAVPGHPPRVSPLYYSLRLGDSCLAQCLILKRPRDLYASDINGKTALHVAIYLSDCKAAQMLIERGADIDCRDDEGCTPLHYAMHDDEHNGISHCVQLLLDHGANVDAQNNHGSTPLHLAASRTRQETVQLQLLVKASANIDLQNNQGQTALHKASQRGHLDIVRLLLDHGADLDLLDNQGFAPLHLASQPMSQEIIKLFLENGADINLPNDVGQTALHLASKHGHLDVIQLLLNLDVDVDALDYVGLTPMHMAIFNASLEVVQLLIEHGANVNLQNNIGQMALHLASRRGHLDIIRLILNHNADVDTPDNDDSTPLHLAISVASLEAVHLLLERGANIHLQNIVGRSALHLASQRGHLDIIQLILNHDADVNALDNSGSPPLQLAISDASPEAVQLLLKNGANINLQNNMGQAALHQASKRGHLDVLQLILNYEVDIDALDNSGSTPIHLAVSEACPETVQLLLNRGAKINLQNHMGQIALHRASQRGHLDIIRLILDHDADIDALDNDGLTPLYLAISEKSLEAVQLLLNHGASINLQNNTGQTALHRASQRGHLFAMQWLLNFGADVETLDNDGSTPLHIAVSEARLGAVQLLLKHGAGVHRENNRGETPFQISSAQGLGCQCIFKASI